jgi:hypothetical protein
MAGSVITLNRRHFSPAFWTDATDVPSEVVSAFVTRRSIEDELIRAQIRPQSQTDNPEPDEKEKETGDTAPEVHGQDRAGHSTANSHHRQYDPSDVISDCVPVGYLLYVRAAPKAITARRTERKPARQAYTTEWTNGTTAHRFDYSSRL